MQVQSDLCKFCYEIFRFRLENIDRRDWTYYEAESQSFEAFREAAHQRCFVCSTLWNLSERYQAVWPNANVAWKPLTYCINRGQNLSYIEAHITYHDPIEGIDATKAFYAISPQDKDYGHLFSFENVSESTFSIQTLDLAHRWYEDCVNQHENCRKDTPSLPICPPTRLIDIGNDSDTNWCLKIVREDIVTSTSPQYMTLSYRWPADPELLLLTSNINDLRNGLPFGRLPQVFKDFIMVVRRFGVRYVWIDSLCILQDSQLDWELESPKMKEVYGNSLCNVAASGSLNSKCSMFNPRIAKDIHPGRIRIECPPAKCAEYYINVHAYMERHLSDGPLHERGWVFQEVILAPRVLYFASKQIMWECTSEHKCEGFPRGIPFYESLKDIRALVPKRRINEKLPTHSMESKFTKQWINTVSKYNCCKFTKPEDKLWALSGVAELFQEATVGRYLAGLWESSLLDMLAWHVMEPRPRPFVKYVAPSWSWASIDGQIMLPEMSHVRDHLAEILEAKVEPVNGAVYGGISAAHLQVRGLIVTAKYRCRSHYWRFDIELPTATLLGSGALDTTETDPCPEESTNLLLLTYQISEAGRPEISCLVLEALKDEPGVYKRIGYVNVFSKSDYEHTHAEILRAAATECELKLV